MSSIVYNDMTEKIGAHYDASNSAISFSDLPEQARSVIVDLAYRFGPNYGHSTIAGKKQIWTDFVAHDYGQAAKDILSYLGPNDQRAKNDAAKLREIVR